MRACVRTCVRMCVCRGWGIHEEGVLIVKGLINGAQINRTQTNLF